VSIVADPDPKYPRLVQVLGHEESVRLLAFVSAPDRDTTLSLSPSHDKDTRTKVRQSNEF